MMSFLRSVLAYIICATVLIVRLPLRKKVNEMAETDLEASMNTLWPFAHWIGRMACRVLKVETEINGLENVPEDSSVLFVGNHQSMFDAPLMLAAIPRASGFVVKEELQKVPVFAKWIAAMGCLFLPRGESRKSLQIIIEASKMLKNNNLGMVIFPEGTRSHDGSMGLFKPGSLKIATRSGAAIVPFAIEHTADVMPRGTWIIKSGKVKVTFLPAITPEEVKAKETTELTAQIMQDIAAIVGCEVPKEEEAVTENQQAQE